MLFPDWVKPRTECKRFTRNVWLPTPHGVVRREVVITKRWGSNG